MRNWSHFQCKYHMPSLLSQYHSNSTVTLDGTQFVLSSIPRDIEDDGEFRYAMLGPKFASSPGRPAPEARRFIDEYTGPDRPRVYRNAVVLVVPEPSKRQWEIASRLRGSPSVT
jgi:hypothetical protein